LLIAYQNQRKALEDVLNGSRPYDRASEQQFVKLLTDRIARLEKLRT